MKSKFAAVMLIPLALSLSACGDTWGQRAVTGGAIGTGAGPRSGQPAKAATVRPAPVPMAPPVTAR